MQVQDHNLKNAISALTAFPLGYSETVFRVIVPGFSTVGALRILCDRSVSSAVASTLPLFPIPAIQCLIQQSMPTAIWHLKITESPKGLLFMWVTLVIFIILEIKGEKL